MKGGHTMYKCKPERNVKQIFLLLITSIVLTVGAFSVGVYLQNGLVKLLGWLFLIAAIYLLFRYSLTEVEYTLDNGTFIITKIVGTKRTEQGSLDLADTVALIPKAEYRQKKMRRETTTYCNYSQNIGGNRWCYICEFGEKKATIEFEPNNAFVALFKEEIEKAKRGDFGGNSGADDNTHGGLLI